MPLPGRGNPHNDYGPGFYCTENLEIAKEWACKGDGIGVANKYTLDCEGLCILDLSAPGYNILNWLAILLDNREFELTSPIPSHIKEYILAEYLPDYKSADLIRGYRADDSYFTFAKDFLTDVISLSQLSRAMKLGRLGEQIVLKSARSFDRIQFEEAIAADGLLYYPRRLMRDAAAREDYRKIRLEGLPADSVIAYDIVRQNWHNDDPRLQ